MKWSCRLKDFFYNMGLRKKLLCSFLLLTLLPTLTIGIFSYAISYQNIVHQKITETQTLLKQIVQKVDEVYSSARYALIHLNYDENARRLLEIEEPDFERYQKERFALEKTLVETSAQIEMGYMAVCGKNGLWLSNNRHFDDQVRAVLDQHAFTDFVSSSESSWDGPVVNIDNRYYKLLSRKLYGEGQDVVGYSLLLLEEQAIRGIFREYQYGDSGGVLLANSDGKIFTAEGFPTAQMRTVQELCPGLVFSAPSGEHETRIEGQRAMASYLKSDEFSVVAVTPMSEILEDPNKILTITVLLMVVMTIISVLSSTLLSRFFATPLFKLADVMKRAERGEPGARFQPKYNDEVGYLARCYNQMMEEKQRQIELTEELRVKQRKAELKAFEAQIKPHFLYNTLSTVIWLIENEEYQKATTVVSALSKLFRISLSRGRNIISVEKELEHVRSYLEIQMIRYEGEFTYRFEVEEEVLSCLTVKMVLQPLVENAIYHAMHLISDGEIVISAKISDGKLLLTVRDNGGLMTLEQAKKINAKLRKMPVEKADFGVGIVNVNDRIRFVCGDEYGLYFICGEGYTVARLILPIDLKGEDNVADSDCR